jgi:serine/threonine-protein kinase
MRPSRRTRLAITGLLVALAGCEFRPGTPQGPGQPTASRTREVDGMTMVYVPRGQFRMGARSPGLVTSGSFANGNFALHVFADEQPRHSVCLDPFWIDRTEVTVAMFRRFVEATGYLSSAERDGWGKPWRDGPQGKEWPKVQGADWLHPGGPENSAQDDHPVVQVSWQDASAYCAWAGAFLPTEAQWEFAARGTHGYDDGYSYTAPVGSYPEGASPFGALDMAGNVWEWVADWYDADYYEHSPCWNPAGPESGTDRVMRGGAWYDGQAEAWTRCSVRHNNPPWDRYEDVGFRCAAAGSIDRRAASCCRHEPGLRIASRLMALINSI